MFPCYSLNLAEREGFEPSKDQACWGSPPCRFSRPVHSTALPPLRHQQGHPQHLLPALSLAISAAAVLVVSAAILFDTSRMVHDGQTNYVMMTVSLYANIYVLFLHLLNLFHAFSGEG
jgi:hypothetical protein